MFKECEVSLDWGIVLEKLLNDSDFLDGWKAIFSNRDGMDSLLLEFGYQVGCPRLPYSWRKGGDWALHYVNKESWCKLSTCPWCPSQWLWIWRIRKCWWVCGGFRNRSGWQGDWNGWVGDLLFNRLQRGFWGGDGWNIDHESLRLPADTEANVGPIDVSLLTVVVSVAVLTPVIWSPMSPSGAARLIVGLSGAGSAVWIAENAWPPLVDIFGMISSILSKYGKSLLRNGAMILFDWMELVKLQ